MAGPLSLTLHHLHCPLIVRSRAVDTMAGGDIGSPLLPIVSIRWMGSIAAIPLPCVDLPAWSELPPTKPSWAKEGAVKTTYRPVAFPLDIIPTSDDDVVSTSPATALHHYHIIRWHHHPATMLSTMSSNMSAATSLSVPTTWKNCVMMTSS